MVKSISNDTSFNYSCNEFSVDLNKARNRINKIENINLSLFLSVEKKSFIYKIVEKIKSIFNVEKKIEFIKTKWMFNLSKFLTDDIRKKKVKDLDKITISKKELHDFIIDYNDNNKLNSFNWFVGQYVKTKDDLLLVTKIAYFLEDNKRKFNPFKLIIESKCISNYLFLFNSLITEVNNEIKKKIFFDIIEDYFDKNKSDFESSLKVKKLDLFLENSYVIERSDELKQAFKNIMKNMINKNIDFNEFIKDLIGIVVEEIEGVEETKEVKKLQEYFNRYCAAEYYLKVLNDVINKYKLDCINHEQFNKIMKNTNNIIKDINSYIFQHLNKINDDSYIGIDKEQYLIRVDQILDVFKRLEC